MARNVEEQTEPIHPSMWKDSKEGSLFVENWIGPGPERCTNRKSENQQRKETGESVPANTAELHFGESAMFLRCPVPTPSVLMIYLF